MRGWGGPIARERKPRPGVPHEGLARQAPGRGAQASQAYRGLGYWVAWPGLAYWALVRAQNKTTEMGLGPKSSLGLRPNKK